MVYCLYSEKRDGHKQQEDVLLGEIKEFLRIEGASGIRVLNRYLVEGLSREQFLRISQSVLSDAVTDITSEQLPVFSGTVIAAEFLPGQFDQRADSASQCIQLVLGGKRPTVSSAKIYNIDGTLSDSDVERLKAHLINPVESREATLDIPTTLAMPANDIEATPVIEGFCDLAPTGDAEFIKQYGLSMDEADVEFCKQYFKERGSDPTLTELRVIDTYWSDHCRHTTFNTELSDIATEDTHVSDALLMYEQLREELGRSDRPRTLMDMGTIAAKKLKKDGLLPLIDESDEINACTVKTDIDGEPYLILFKNETHNHPTEIEPFGGAATCIGGAIRDPLSGRAYVYQAMRVTGAGDPTQPVENTMKGKLPQRRICELAAHGYSSYGNQIGLATGLVDEIYHPGYAAKRMEIGAVVGAVPQSRVRREQPSDGDVVVLLGGRTGRDGCGGATGSSKSHNLQSLDSCGAEVQKGNAPEERKLQRLFARPEVTCLIKKCNDFGAGGVAVAVGELADGLTIDLSAVPLKYEGLSATETAISESQERMAIVVQSEHAQEVIDLARLENVEATVIATVTAEPTLVMNYNGQTVLKLDREFLDTNGAKRSIKVQVAHAVQRELPKVKDFFSGLKNVLTDLNGCGKKGLCEMFDSTIGAKSALMPFGGKHQSTPTDVMAALVADSDTATVMSYGFDPYRSECDPFVGAYNAVTASLCKLAAAGAWSSECYLTFQEYFERPGADPVRWGKPTAALLGALKAQLDYGVAAIGGKDSMSGSFEKLDVPPTLVSFALSVCDGKTLVSPEFKNTDSDILLLCPAYDENGMPNAEDVLTNMAIVQSLADKGTLISCKTPGFGGIARALALMAMGNNIGFDITSDTALFEEREGRFIMEVASGTVVEGATKLGRTLPSFVATVNGDTQALEQYVTAYNEVLSHVYPIQARHDAPSVAVKPVQKDYAPPRVSVAGKPKFLIPTFPGTNCELDTAAAIERAGGVAEVFVLKNLTPDDVEQSAKRCKELLATANVLVLPGGFSGGDEPDGSGKFITSFFRNEALREGIHDLLHRRDGLALGICNGFQALIKLGLVPHGSITERAPQDMTLAHNIIGRHQSGMVRTVVSQINTPWLSKCKVGEVYTVPISHGEGRFCATQAQFDALASGGQVATQYVDLDGNPTQDIAFNPNGSFGAVEGITSECGRVYGKMGHSERALSGLYKNIPDINIMPLFEGAVGYFVV